MPIQINTSIKGKEYPPYVVHVERAKIQFMPDPEKIYKGLKELAEF